MGYLANFMIYTLAMIGVIAVALLVFKNSNSFSSGKSKYLKVIDTLSIAPRKNLYIISAGKEKFLIAGDADKTTLISKLGNAAPEIEDVLINKEEKEESFKTTMGNLSKSKFMDKQGIGINSSILTQNTKPHSVMRSLAERIK